MFDSRNGYISVSSNEFYTEFEKDNRRFILSTTPFVKNGYVLKPLMLYIIDETTSDYVVPFLRSDIIEENDIDLNIYVYNSKDDKWEFEYINSEDERYNIIKDFIETFMDDIITNREKKRAIKLYENSDIEGLILYSCDRNHIQYYKDNVSYSLVLDRNFKNYIGKPGDVIIKKNGVVYIYTSEDFILIKDTKAAVYRYSKENKLSEDMQEVVDLILSANDSLIRAVKISTDNADAEEFKQNMKLSYVDGEITLYPISFSLPNIYIVHEKIGMSKKFIGYVCMTTYLYNEIGKFLSKKELLESGIFENYK